MSDRKLLMLIRLYGDALGLAGHYADRDEDAAALEEREAKRVMKLIRAELATRQSAQREGGVSDGK